MAKLKWNIFVRRGNCGAVERRAVYLWIYYAQRAEATCVANYLRHFETIRNKHFDAWRRHARNSFGAMRAHAR